MRLRVFLGTDSGGIIQVILGSRWNFKKWYVIVFIRRHLDGGVMVFIFEFIYCIRYIMTFILGQYRLLCVILLLISVHALEVQAHYLTLNPNYTF